jgi:hypothetical protein
LESLVDGPLPSNVRDAVSGWARTAWWVDADGNGTYLTGEKEVLERLENMEGVEELFRSEPPRFVPEVPREDADRWLEERGVRVAAEERDPRGEFGRSAREEYGRALEAWKRRLDHGGEGTPHGSYWDDVVPVQPLPEAG